MTVEQSIQLAVSKLKNANVINPTLDAEILLAFTLQCRREELVTNSNCMVASDRISVFNSYIQ